ncbi:MAG TPA: TIGR03621 family F420-dependent LLM class oxidoreductase [Ktedonobacteraceae bacterium]|nr:TIGR03621 family F420-dependent LLM class oxidoreductase [Ktedonobacteraceae bacterium]
MKNQHPFRFGVICEQMDTQHAWVTKARQIEDAGYATLLIRDHFVREPFGDQFAPIAALMAAADATTTLRVGNLVMDNDYRHPVILAKEAATLDVLSHGRFELGLGAGWAKREYEQAGIPFDAPGVRVNRLEEALQVVKGLWSPSALTFSGSHYTIDHLNGFPKPVQRPHPPILVGASGKRMLSLAAREATIIGFLTGDYSTGVAVDDPLKRLGVAVAQKIAWVQQAAGERFSDLELSMMIRIIHSEDQQRTAEHLASERGWSSISAEQVLDMPSIVIGSVEQIIEQLYQRREHYGFSYYIVTDQHMQTLAPVVRQLAGKA